MLFHCFEERGLEHYSYLVGCKEKRQAAIIDPHCDVEIYLTYAEKHQLIISHVFETHIQADYISGAYDLAMRTGARLHLSSYDKGEKYEVSFDHHPCLEGDLFRLGAIQLEVLHTPGSTPEHISFLVYDLKQSTTKPKGIFCGDFLFTSISWRSTLLEGEAVLDLAKKFYQVIQDKIKPLPDELEIFSAHPIKSYQYGKENQLYFSKLGIERLSNPFLNPRLSEEELINYFLSQDGVKLSCYASIKKSNAKGQSLKIPKLTSLNLNEFKQAVDACVTVIDLRGPAAFARGHIPGAIFIGSGEKAGFWAARSVPYDHPFVFVTDDPTRLEETIHQFARVGLFQVKGYLQGGFATWTIADLPVSYLVEITPQEVIEKRESHGDCKIIDVRSAVEWNTGHIPGATHLSCLDFLEHIDRLPNTCLIFICAGGYRSTWAASLARRHGHKSVGHVIGGMHAWQRAGFEIT
jgi:hydroxyacylglutathione hydrolase